MIKIPSVGHLKYDRFRRNIKQDHCIQQNLEALSCNSDDNYHLSSTIHLCRYFAENYEDEFIIYTGNSSLTFFVQISAVKTASMMSHTGFDIY